MSMQDKYLTTRELNTLLKIKEIVNTFTKKEPFISNAIKRIKWELKELDKIHK